jgi:hypothetical protein
MARVIADAPPLKAAVATNDPPTVQDVVDDFPKQLNSNLLLVTSRSGQVLGTVAHEFFHLWNVKRIHPDMLGPFDYEREVRVVTSATAEAIRVTANTP